MVVNQWCSLRGVASFSNKEVVDFVRIVLTVYDDSKPLDLEYSLVVNLFAGEV